MEKNEKEKLVSKNLENELDEIDFNSIPSSDQFQKTKVKPPKRWFNSIMALEVFVSGTCLGVVIAILVLHFCGSI